MDVDVDARRISAARRGVYLYEVILRVIVGIYMK